MKIKFVQQREVSNQQQELPLEVMKKEAVEEEEHQGYEWPTPDENPNKPVEDNTNPVVQMPPDSSDDPPIALGKRKRKPKELIDEISPVFVRRKKKPAIPKPKDVLPTGELKPFTKREKASGDGLNSPLQMKSPTVLRAEEVLASLGNEYPIFMKPLVRSHVASCFWMGLPVPFCKQHLPRKDGSVVLENESGEEYDIKYISEKTGLSAGWRKFVAAHRLLEGDVLIFQLVAANRFKVYVIRANDLNEVDGALSLLNLDVFTKQNDAGEGSAAMRNKKRRKSLPLTVVQKKNKKAGLLRPGPHPDELSGNDSEEVASEVLEGSKFLAPAVRFTDIKSFEEFNIVVNGVCIDSELPEHIRRKYYDLCCSKDMFLHERILPGMYCKLAAGMICETVNTADAIKACNLNTTRQEFEILDKSLKSFELLGMNVGFLRARLRRLIGLAFECEDAIETKRYWEAKTERVRTEDEIKNLEAKLVELKDASQKYDTDIEALRSKAESYELMFQEEVNAPW